ncbi:beta-ketoacyl-ACP reductase [Microbacterium faecale]|uniref:Beta-ketoacyl-ACP reductase n=1 Tax=Microbacterium faecale TaxID=1804630 RepID=A0A917DC16_9MICO|nr:SDR family NAD(P)-dependent oxidoreductase [Microbacterium faecale]GGD24583.1 beta-ketoacyl-ACP reductase [Microbacterium faecale]
MTERVALVTGCGKPDGMGQAIVRRLAAQGYRVVASDVAPQGLANDAQRGDAPAAGWSGVDSLVEQVRASGGTADSVLGDISDEADAHRMVAETVERFGRLDVLVNNAAAPQGDDRADIEEVPVSTFDRIVAINLRGTYLMCLAAVPVMRTQRYGRIVNVASMAGVEAMPLATAYSASKAGVLGFTRALAMDVGAWSITANAVCPGLVWTSRGRFGVSTPEEEAAARTRFDAGIVSGRVGVPEDIAAAVAYLAADENGYVTGQEIHVNGGGISVFPRPRPEA